jgi:hypothetical protein
MVVLGQNTTKQMLVMYGTIWYVHVFLWMLHISEKWKVEGAKLKKNSPSVPQLFKENNVQTCPTIIKKISIDVEGLKKGK